MIKLDEQCSSQSLVHEFLHVLGLFHMHTSPERDDYIEVLWDNLTPAGERNFKIETVPTSMFGTKCKF